MKTKRISPATAVICCLLFLFAACSLASAAEFQGASGAFTIDPPAGWKRMDPRVLDAMVDLYAQDRLDAAGGVTRYGFMLPLSDTVTNPPCLVVEMRNAARVPDRLVNLQTDHAFLKHAYTEILKKHGVLERNIIDISYNSGQHRLHLSYTEIPPFGLREKNRISRWINFTEQGAINVIVACPNQDWEQWSNVLERAAASMQIAENLRYHPHTAELAAANATETRNSLTFSAVFFGSGIFFLFFRRRCNTVMSDEI